MLAVVAEGGAGKSVMGASTIYGVDLAYMVPLNAPSIGS
jgi:hypothetical protein